MDYILMNLDSWSYMINHAIIVTNVVTRTNPDDTYPILNIKTDSSLPYKNLYLSSKHILEHINIKLFIFQFRRAYCNDNKTIQGILIDQTSIELLSGLTSQSMNINSLKEIQMLKYAPKYGI